MKEAAGEANLTVIAIILIGVIAAIMTPVINGFMTTAAKKGCCSNYGGVWDANACNSTNNTGAKTVIEESTYWNSGDKTCK